MTEGRVQWYRQFSNEEMKPFPDIENEIIEDAYQKREKKIELDDYIIELDDGMQISKENSVKKISIKRLTNIESYQHLRPERFFSNEIQASPENVKTYGEHDLGSIFIRRWLYRNNLAYYDLITNQSIASNVLAMATCGILTEGIQLGKEIETKWICNYLENVIGKSSIEILQCCVHLYTRESFLYKLVNKTLREEDTTKIDTLAPFCALLAAYLRKCCVYDDAHVHSLISTNDNSYFDVVYRGANLTVEMIEAYRKGVGKSFVWNSFTSTSKNRQKAELYGNTLFVIHIDIIPSIGFQSFADIQPYSQFPIEEEVLLAAGGYIKIYSINEQPDGKYVIVFRTVVPT
ncbi:unnamed protein product [Didymodactylos carnosus]|uniref:NAD(P)(+)--arginine ADP-ribosyltransferase n=1 Tax=Didymodactylos carnosus TaxID=1234261 RepID=A0A815ZJS0_9BILA|nr:unnamed protein product [Didymodactylos carnosus]CAF1583351.1 unnamed protein product [Didymodactylos carnosus]CAF4030895.1 unnamed protein product [Didymodactylos carnosus]CAF4451714.1 unnamed protein product [Didymodactylos carnosus]